MKLLIIVLAIIIIGCSETALEDRQPKKGMYCSDQVNLERKKFILICVEKANPMSDEEPEDWIAQCEKSSLILCSPGFMYHAGDYLDTQIAPCSKATTRMEKFICNDGWIEE